MSDRKTVVITGASGEIGSAIAVKFANAPAPEKYNIVIAGNHNSEKLVELSEKILRTGNECMTYQGDISVSGNVSELFNMVKDRFGNVDILINNAGISYIGLITDMSDDEWHRVIETNLGSVFYCCRAVAPAMVTAKKGCIINISSVWGEHGASCEVAYSASKGGINAFTKALAKELAPSGINVNAVACGLIDTKMNSHLSTEEMNSLYEEIPAGRAGSTEEVASIVYGITKETSYMTGQIIKLDGGWM